MSSLFVRFMSRAFTARAEGGAAPTTRLASGLGALGLLSGAAFMSTLGARPAAAYPQFAFKGYGDCGTCHHSPTGGGFANRWGRDSMDAAFGQDWGLGFGNQDLAYDESNPGGIQVDLGVDLRMVPIYGTDSDAPVGPVVIPMLTEIGGAVSAGRWVAYGSLTTMPSDDSLSGSYGSREHWLMFRAGEGFSVRAGRLVLPFGIRQADHTQYVREDLGFRMYDQSYSVEVDYRGQEWSVFGNMFAGDLTTDSEALQERGLVITAQRNLSGGTSVGGSGLGGLTAGRNRLAASLFANVALGSSGYALLEVAGQNTAARRGTRAESTLAEFVRLGWFAVPSLDVYVEGGHRDATGSWSLTKSRAALGANWQVTSFLELAPQFSAESREGVPGRYLAFLQIHAVY